MVRWRTNDLEMRHKFVCIPLSIPLLRQRRARNLFISREFAKYGNSTEGREAPGNLRDRGSWHKAGENRNLARDINSVSALLVLIFALTGSRSAG